MDRKPSKQRSRHSYRDAIQRAILDRIALGKPLNTREILKDAGGGSASTVVDELRRIEPPAPAALVGRGAKSLPQRVFFLEEALNTSITHKKNLEAENLVLKEALAVARSDLEKMLTTHQDSQRMLLQGVDDLRQMVRAGQGRGSQQPAADGSPQKPTRIAAENNIQWKERHDQLLQQYINLDARCRRMAVQLHDLGIELD